MWSNGADHQEMRKFTTRTLKTFGFGEPKTAEGFLQEELTDCLRLLDEKREKQNNELHIHQTFKISTFNVLWRVMAGSRF
jgi:hypothetical protein